MITRLNSSSINAKVNYTPMPSTSIPDLKTCLLLHFDSSPTKDYSVYNWNIKKHAAIHRILHHQPNHSVRIWRGRVWF